MEIKKYKREPTNDGSLTLNAKTLELECQMQIESEIIVKGSIDGRLLFTNKNHNDVVYELEVNKEFLIKQIIRLLGQEEHKRQVQTRTDKDKENQKKLDRIRDAMVDHEFNNTTLVQFWTELVEITKTSRD